MPTSRVLFICGSAPWPRNGGSMLRNYYLIRALSEAYRVDVVTADRPDGAIPGEFAAMVDDFAAFPRSENARSGVGRVARVAVGNQSSLTAGWTNAAMHEYVADRVGRYPYAAIMLDLPMIGALPRRNAIPIVYNAHNCETALQLRRASVEKPHIAAALGVDAVRVRQIEKALVERSALVAACSLNDVFDFQRFVPSIRDKATIVPNGVDVCSYEHIRTMPSTPHTVLITGSMDWRPNLLGLRWFLAEGLARLRKRMPDAHVQVAGRMQPALVAELAKYPGVEAIPNPPSMQSLLAAATVVAAPIVASSGTRLRILEAWAAGRPVVTTTAGAFGLPCESGRDMMIRDEPEKFADAIATLLMSAATRTMLVHNAAERAQRYDWRVLGERLVDAFHENIDRLEPSAPRASSVPVVVGV